MPDYFTIPKAPPTPLISWPQAPGVPIAQGMMLPNTPFMNLAGQGAPAAAAGPAPQAPIQLPQMPDLSAPLIDPAQMKELQDRADSLKSVSQKAKDRLDNIASEMMADPTMQQSPFEKQMEQGLQSRMIKLMAGSDDSMGSRFGKGFDLGQKIGANLIAPLMGAFSHSAGGKIGALASTQQLQQQIAQEKQNRIAQEAERNATLAHLASMYETMSPSSAKNLFALATQKLQTDQYNRTTKNEAFKDALEAAGKSESAQKDILTAKEKAVNDEDQRKLGAFNANVNVLRAVDQSQGRIVNEQNADRRIKDSESNTERRFKDSEANAQKRFEATDQREKDKVNAATEHDRTQALQQITLRMRQLRNDIDATNAQGQPKYPHAEAYTKNNDAEMQAFDELFKKAGLKTTAKEAIEKAFKDREDSKGAPQPGSQDWLGQLLQGGKDLLSGPQKPKLDVSSIPTEKFHSIANKKGVKKVNGVWVVQ